MGLVQNAVIKEISDESIILYRIISIAHNENRIFLYRLSPEVEKKKNRLKSERKMRSANYDEIKNSYDQGLIQDVELDTVSFRKFDIEHLSVKTKATFDDRCNICDLFFDSEKVRIALLTPRGIGTLVQEIRREHEIARSSLNRYFALLCKHGFDARSLIPDFDKCGAPGTSKYWDESKRKVGRKTDKQRAGNKEEYPQCGVTKVDADLIKKTYKKVIKVGQFQQTTYDKIVEIVWVRKLKQTETGIESILPAQGTIPNRRQVARVIRRMQTVVERKKLTTSPGHFQRNYRGLHGKAYDAIAGPGHRYEIDATYADVYLRSSVNRAWPIGRPITYLLKCPWSTAIVGFHVTVTPPSWEAAKLAIYCASIGMSEYGKLWGIDTPMLALTPPPTLPHGIYGDRGEHLSKAARETAQTLGFNLLISPPYRGDLKGSTEVGHRLEKDEQVQYLPGAIDARRNDIEARCNPEDGKLTLKEYVEFIMSWIEKHNFSTTRTERLTSEMISQDVEASSAGVWRFGHDAGIGYQIAHPSTSLKTALFPKAIATVRRDGVHFDGLIYDSPYARENDWSGHARLSGTYSLEIFYFPGNNAQIWWLNDKTKSLESLFLTPSARAQSGTSFEEWDDLQAYENAKIADKAHHTLRIRLNHQARVGTLVETATVETAKADEAPRDAIPSIPEAKILEQRRPQKTSAEPISSVSAPPDRNEQEYYSILDSALNAALGRPHE